MLHETLTLSCTVSFNLPSKVQSCLFGAIASSKDEVMSTRAC